MQNIWGGPSALEITDRYYNCQLVPKTKLHKTQPNSAIAILLFPFINELLCDLRSEESQLLDSLMPKIVLSHFERFLSSGNRDLQLNMNMFPCQTKHTKMAHVIIEKPFDFSSRLWFQSCHPFSNLRVHL